MYSLPVSSFLWFGGVYRSREASCLRREFLLLSPSLSEIPNVLISLGGRVRLCAFLLKYFSLISMRRSTRSGRLPTVMWVGATKRSAVDPSVVTGAHVASTLLGGHPLVAGVPQGRAFDSLDFVGGMFPSGTCQP